MPVFRVEHLVHIPTVHKQSNRYAWQPPASDAPTATQNTSTQRCSPQPNKSATSLARPGDDSDGSSPAGNQHTHPSKTGRCSALGQQAPESPQPCTQQLATSPSCLAVNRCNQVAFVFFDLTKVYNSSSSVTSDVAGLGGCAGRASTYFFSQRPIDCPLPCSIRLALRWLIPSATSRSAYWRVWGL